MVAPIALQLYSVRDIASKEFEKTISKIAEMGYIGIELASITGISPEKAAKIIRAYDISLTSVHTTAPVGDRKNEIVEMMTAINCPSLVIPYQPKEAFTSREEIQKVCELMNEANQVARENHFTLGYHNHWWEAEYHVDGKPAYQIMLEYLDQDIFFQVDTYWMQVGGVDAARAIAEIGRRASMLHLKDGPGFKNQPMTAIGDGIMNWKSIISTAGDVPEWMIVELDSCATDMLTAVEKSYQYLIREGFACGKR